ncbi:hypothetical protein ABZ470_04065 [Streptosporangium sp. NPDC020072]|uniref:Uncharacterized protein n=1 Tax=Streptosporangium jomthongense TaxID=1193683 RepID=A0ABV8F710_9ACTN
MGVGDAEGRGVAEETAAGCSSGIVGLVSVGPLIQNVVASRPTSAKAPPTRAEPRPRITSHRPSGARTSHEMPSRSMWDHHRRSWDTTLRN